MVIEYTGRQVAVTQKYKDQAETGLKAIERIVDRAVSAKVVLITAKYRKIAEVTVTSHGQSMVARREGVEMATALRDALARIEQQAVRQKRKATTTNRHPRPEVRAQSGFAAESAATA